MEPACWYGVRGGNPAIRRGDLFAPVSEPPAGASLSHRPPKIPFTVAGVTYDPADIKRFDGQPLHFVWRQLGDQGTQLIGFVGNEWLRGITAYFQLQQLGMLAAPAVAGYGAPLHPSNAHYAPGPYYHPGGSYWVPYPGRYAGQIAAGISPGYEVLPTSARFYEHANNQGDRMRVDGNHTCYDLTKIGRGFLNLADWNDVISSVKSNGATLLLFEHIHFAGDTLLVLPMELLNNLADVGWNDRVSSIKNFGKIY